MNMAKKSTRSRSTTSKSTSSAKAEVVLELLEAAVPIPITLGLDSVKVIGRKGEEEKE